MRNQTPTWAREVNSGPPKNPGLCLVKAHSSSLLMYVWGEKGSFFGRECKKKKNKKKK